MKQRLQTQTDGAMGRFASAATTGLIVSIVLGKKGYDVVDAAFGAGIGVVLAVAGESLQEVTGKADADHLRAMEALAAGEVELPEGLADGT